jgi:hypothetical protein
MTDTMPSFEGDRVKTVQINGQKFHTFKFSVNLALRRSNLIPIVGRHRLKPDEPVYTYTSTEITISYFTYIYIQSSHYLLSFSHVGTQQCRFPSGIKESSVDQQMESV